TPAAAFRRHDDVALDHVGGGLGHSLFSWVVVRGLLAALASSRRRAPSISRKVVDAWISSTPPTSPARKSNEPAPQVTIWYTAAAPETGGSSIAARMIRPLRRKIRPVSFRRSTSRIPFLRSISSTTSTLESVIWSSSPRN